MKKQLLLCLLSLVLISVFFVLPRNLRWAKVLRSYSADFDYEKSRLQKEQRMKRRFGSHYTLSKSIADSIASKTSAGNVLVLLPPTTYFEKMGIKYHVPEPAVFYYFTGLKTIWANSDSAINADWYIRVEGGKLLTEKVRDRKSFADTIRSFKSMGVSL